jgi:hypothetical protein
MPLRGLSRLSKLTVIGSRLKGTKAIVRVLRSCPDAEIVDFRCVSLFSYALAPRLGVSSLLFTSISHAGSIACRCVFRAAVRCTD